MPSITTILLSTSIPIAMMKAPKEIRCNVVPICISKGKDAAIVKTNPVPIITPPRHPIENTNSRITMSTDSTRFRRKELIASFTLSGWKKIFSVVIPAGMFSNTSASFWSAALPTSGTTTSSSIAMQIARAGLPLTKNPLRCGEA